MSALARGATGRLLCGHHAAARLGAWTIATPDAHFAAGEWTLEAAVVERDAFWFVHGDRFALELAMGAAVWRWSAVTLAARDPLSITGHGAPEVIPA